jgi:hypothetical protein
MIGYDSEAWMRMAANLKRTSRGSFSRGVKGADISQLVNIALEINPRHPQRDRLAIIYREWYSINPNVFRFICKRESAISRSDDIIGFTSMVPLTDEGFNEYRAGRLSEWNFGAYSPYTRKNYIAPVSAGPQSYICIQAIKVKPRYWLDRSPGLLCELSFQRL